ncbi:MAG: hypothetical protein ACE5HI_03195, partial [bacterium]
MKVKSKNNLTAVKSKEMELERRVFHLQTLYEVAHALNYCRDRAQIYKEVLSILMGTFGVEYGLALASTAQNE